MFEVETKGVVLTKSASLEQNETWGKALSFFRK